MRNKIILALGMVFTPFFMICQTNPIYPDCQTMATNELQEKCSQEKIVSFVHQYLIEKKAFETEADTIFARLKLNISEDGIIDTSDVILVQGEDFQSNLIKESLLLLSQQTKMIFSKPNKVPLYTFQEMDIILSKEGFQISIAFYRKEIVELFVIVEQMPVFPGCENVNASKKTQWECTQKGISNFVNSHLEYPKEAKNRHIEGIVVVQFVVNKNGRVSHIEVTKSLKGGCNEEAKRVIELMNDMDENWIPGYHNGKAVPVVMALAVKFSKKNFNIKEEK